MTRLPDTFIVVCRDNGKYVLATRVVFGTRESAELYAGECAESREALVIPGDFRNLRFPERNAQGGCEETRTER